MSVSSGRNSEVEANGRHPPPPPEVWTDEEKQFFFFVENRIPSIHSEPVTQVAQLTGCVSKLRLEPIQI
jgi:hypothetical protein